MKQSILYTIEKYNIKIILALYYKEFMNTSIFLYDDIETNEFIDDILTYIQDKEFHDGQVGQRVDIKQKKRQGFLH